MIIDIKDIFYRSEYKHKKFYFVNEAAELYLKRKVQNYICRYEIEIFKKRCINKIKDIKNMKELKIENSETWEISKSRKSRKYYSELSHFWVFWSITKIEKLDSENLEKKQDFGDFRSFRVFDLAVEAHDSRRVSGVSFPRISAETVCFQKNSTPGNYVKFGYFAKYFLLICIASKKLLSSFKVWSYSLLLYISLK